MNAEHKAELRAMLRECGSCDYGIPGPCTCGPDLRQPLTEALDEIDRLNTALANLQGYAEEGWSWVENLCKWGGWSDVFDAQDQDHTRRADVDVDVAELRHEVEVLRVEREWLRETLQPFADPLDFYKET